MQVRLARDLLGALAFKMFRGPDGQAVSQPTYVVKEKVDDFLTEVFNDFRSLAPIPTGKTSRSPVP